jgi:hypothetical protein
VSSFIWGESIRPTDESSIFFTGKSSRREAMVYIGILLWLVLGAYGILTKSDLLSISAYFASLSPFVSAYIIGQTYKPVAASSLRPQLANKELSNYEPSYAPPDLNYKKEDDPHVQKILEDKKKDPTLPEPDISESDMST